MKRPAIFFDRDNTLILCDAYLGDPTGVVLMEGAADAIARARSLGYATVVVSNQSGVGRGMYEEEAVHRVNQKMDEMLLQQNPAAVIDRHEFCPFHPDASIERYRQDSDLRKPKPGMLLRAAEQLALDLERSWLVGDQPRDIEAGKAAGCRTILMHAPGIKHSPDALTALTDATRPEAIVTTLAEAIDYIERNADLPPPPREETESGEPVATEGEVASMASLSDAASVAEPQPEDEAAEVRATPPGPASLLPPPVPATSLTEVDMKRLEHLTEQILHELRRRNEQIPTEFSVSKLLAGITQVLVLAILFYAYLKNNSGAVQSILTFALVLQALTISLLIMGKQRP